MPKHDTNVNTQNSDSNASPYTETCFIVPRDIIEMEGITFSYVRVYETMYQFWKQGLNVYMSQVALMERTNLSNKQVYQALKFFEDNGKLVRRYVNGKRCLIRPEISIETDMGRSPTGEMGFL